MANGRFWFLGGGKQANSNVVSFGASRKAPSILHSRSHRAMDEHSEGTPPTISDRAYVLINVLPGHTASVVKALAEIPEIKTIDPCWGKPDIFAMVEVSGQDALTALVLAKIHVIEGVAQTDTHLVYRLKA